MSNKDKTRVFVAIYTREGVTNNPQSHDMHHSRFHWAIWTERKGSKHRGCAYQVVKTDRFVNRPGSGGWEYDYHRTASFARSNAMLGRIMVGKIPKGVTPDHVSAVCSQIPVPREDVEPFENCVSWTVAALRELRRHGWVERFNVVAFMEHALERGNYWYRENSRSTRKNWKENYTQRKFP
ncbi:hypothetical protein F5Y03DRAFT_397378 [Xylaria venustula]|nr:hypothetical protein F5Y03DRAFT_397378 [Xylaria venustula]